MNSLKAINKKGIINDYLPWLLIAIAVLAIIVISIISMKESGISFIDHIKNLLRMR